MKVNLPYAIFAAFVLGLLSGCSIGVPATPLVMSTTSPIMPTITSKSVGLTLTPDPPQATLTKIFPTPTVTQPSPTPHDPIANLQSGTYLVFWKENALYLSSLDQPLEIILATVDYPFARLSHASNEIVFSRQGELGIYMMASGQTAKSLVSQDFNYQPNWSPDDTSLVYVHDDEEMVNSSLYVVNVTDGNPTRLTSWPTIERAPAWSPDGKWIAFASDQAKINRTDGSYLGVTEIYLLDTECLAIPTTCESKIKQITDMGANGDSDSPAWSPDSNQLVFMCGLLSGSGDYQKDICMVRRDGFELKNLTNSPENEFWPIWSPDGKYIAFTREDPETRTKDVAVMQMVGQQISLITDTPQSNEVFAFWFVVP